MTNHDGKTERREGLQQECKALKPELARLKLKRELSRQMNIHPNSMDNYLDGFCSDIAIMELLIKKAKSLINKKLQRA